MKKGVKRLVILLGILLILPVLTALVIAGFFQDAIGRKLIKEINKGLKTELTVGHFDLSLLRGFPDATASLRKVTLMGTDGDRLLEADDVSFHFRLMSLFGDVVKVHSVSIRNGALNVRTDKQGKANYEIFKETKTEEDADFHISLERARLDNIELHYRNEKLKQEMLAQVKKAVFSGEFSSKQFDMKSTAELVSNFVDLDGVRYFTEKRWGYDAVISMNLDIGKYDFQNARITVMDNSYNVQGFVQAYKNFSDFDITATAENASLESVIALLPEQYLSALGDFSSKGNFRFLASVKGKLSTAERPAILFEFGLDNGRLTSPRLREPFKDVSFQARFTNGEGRRAKNSVFEISNFKGYLNRELITLDLSIKNLDDPVVDFQADGALPVGDIYGLFNNPAITGGSGEIEIRNLKVSGLYKDMANVRSIYNVSMSGDIGFDDASLKINGEKLMIDRGTLHFEDNLMTLEDLKLEGAGSEIQLRGNARNLLPVLLADTENTKKAVLDFQVELESPVMDLARLIKLTDVPVKEGEVKQAVFDSLAVKKNEKQARISDVLNGTFQASVNKFSYNKIEGRNFNGKLVLENAKMRIEGNANGMEGAFALDGTLFFEKEPRLEAKLNSERVNVKKFFEQTNNAGQEVIKAENISGTMNAKMLIYAYWDSTGHFLPEKLRAVAGVGIQNGELKGLKMLESFSNYARISDLRNVRLEDMQNWIEVSNRTFYLPVMFVQNNAMNLTISGEQTFDDKIDYNIKVNAGQVLANKFKKQNTGLEPIPAKQKGFFNLYFNVSGTLDEYKYETNKRKVQASFDKSESRKRRIRAELIKAFGAPLNMLREPEAWRDEGETARKDDDDLDYIPGF